MWAKISRLHTTGKSSALTAEVWEPTTPKMSGTATNVAETGSSCNVMRSRQASSKIFKSNALSAMVKAKQSPQNATYAKVKS